MNDKRRVENPEDLVDALEELFRQVIMEAPEEPDDFEAADGYDPMEFGRQMAAFAKKCSEESPLNNGGE